MQFHSGDPFPTTQWSNILQAGRNSEQTDSALNDLCTRYWPAVYAFVRHRHFNTQDAEDLTQSYFAGLLKRSYLLRANPEVGRFRAFLIHDLKWFLASVATKESAEKRGGKIHFVSFSSPEDGKPGIEPEADAPDDDAFFDRHWARETVRLAREVVDREYSTEGRKAVFTTLEPGLIAPPDAETYLRWQDELKMSEGAVRVALHRLRQRFREALRKQVLETLASPEDLEEEMRHLRRSLAKNPKTASEAD